MKIPSIFQKRRNRMNKRGQYIMIQLLFLFMTIAVLVALIPALTSILNIAEQSDSLNCPGYAYLGCSTHPLSYNGNLATSTLSCLAIRLYLPYIILAVLIGAVTKVISGRSTQYGGMEGI